MFKTVKFWSPCIGICTLIVLFSICQKGVKMIAGEEIKAGAAVYISTVDDKVYNYPGVGTFDLDTFIERFVGSLSFELLLAWADMFDIEHDEKYWPDDAVLEREYELRVDLINTLHKRAAERNK